MSSSRLSPYIGVITGIIIVSFSVTDQLLIRFSAFDIYKLNYGLDWSGSGQGQVERCCECGNEPLGSIKWWETMSGCTTGDL
jgi:hypothetical protein